MTIRSAAIYARVSTKIQAEHGHSIESQVAACKTKAAEIGALTTREYVDDGFSGAYLERPALDRLRDAMRDHLHDAVIVYDPDRLSRNLAHQLLLTEECEKLNVKLIFVSTEIQDTPEGKMLYQMRGVFAAYEREKFRERSIRGKRSMARKGLVSQDSHVFGYDYDKETKQYVINKAEAKIVELIFDLFVFQKIGGLFQIKEYLNNHHIPSPAGRLWHPESVRAILTRTMYGGEFYFGREYHTKRDATHEVKIPRPESEWIKIDCPSIVPLEYIEKAIAMIDENRKRPLGHYTTAPVLLQGLVFCPLCQRQCGVVNGVKRKISKVRSRYYYCKKRYIQEKCKARMIPAEDLDALVWDAIEQICKSESSLRAYLGSEAKEKKPKKDTKKTIEEKLGFSVCVFRIFQFYRIS